MPRKKDPWQLIQSAKSMGRARNSARIASAAEVDEDELDDEEEIADQSGGGWKGPTVGNCYTVPAPTKSSLGCRSKRRQRITGDEKRGAEDVEPEHHAGEAGKFVGEVDSDFAEPLLRDAGVMVCGVREDVGQGHGAGGPDDLAHLENATTCPGRQSACGR